MDLIERASEARRTYARDRLEHRLDDAERDNRQLREENDSLRTGMRREEEERKRLWSALEKDSRRRGSRLRAPLVLGIAAGVAYIAGTKAGRERYEQLQGWLDGARDRAAKVQGEIESGSARASNAVRSTARDATDMAST